MQRSGSITGSGRRIHLLATGKATALSSQGEAGRTRARPQPMRSPALVVSPPTHQNCSRHDERKPPAMHPALRKSLQRHPAPYTRNWDLFIPKFAATAAALGKGIVESIASLTYSDELKQTVCRIKAKFRILRWKLPAIAHRVFLASSFPPEPLNHLTKIPANKRRLHDNALPAWAFARSSMRGIRRSSSLPEIIHISHRMGFGY